MLNRLISGLPNLWQNWISLFGTILVSLSGTTLVIAILYDLFLPVANSYASTFLFLFIPMFFILGLIIIPIGYWWERRKMRRANLDPADIQSPIQRAFEQALANPKARRKMMFFLSMTFVNTAVIVIAGSRGVHYMNSPEFCGTLCHEVMQPEYNAYKRSPHSRVACVDCHIGPGASWATKAKIDGMRQVWAVFTNSFSRPIPSPVHHLRPARDTCEQCHWPEKFLGNRISFFTKYGDDVDNTPEVSAVALKVGGVDPQTKKYAGIHWHVSPDVDIRYQALDDRREKIGKVEVFEKGQKKAEYNMEGAQGTVMEDRSMDCVDCHNRPTHIYDASPEAAVDSAFYDGRLDRRVKYLRKMSVKVLAKNDYPREGIADTMVQALEKAYETDHPDFKPTKDRLKYFSKVLADLYLANVYPNMNIKWDTYPSHLGHRGGEEDKRGCFRCHDDEHATKDGKTISQDCDMCHELLHMEEGLDDLSDSLKALLPPGNIK